MFQASYRGQIAMDDVITVECGSAKLNQLADAPRALEPRNT